MAEAHIEDVSTVTEPVDAVDDFVAVHTGPTLEKFLIVLSIAVICAIISEVINWVLIYRHE